MYALHKWYYITNMQPYVYNLPEGILGGYRCGGVSAEYFIFDQKLLFLTFIGSIHPVYLAYEGFLIYFQYFELLFNLLNFGYK